MRVAGIDYSTKAVDLVTIPEDGRGIPRWRTFPLQGEGKAFDRARDVANEMPGRNSAFWDDILAVGIEHPGGKYGVGDMLRIQGAILSCIPARTLVRALPPGKWRKLNQLPGNCNKATVAHKSLEILGWGEDDPYDPANMPILRWTLDAHDAHLIARATRSLIRPPARGSNIVRDGDTVFG